MVSLLEDLRAELSADMYALLEEAAGICSCNGWKLYIVGGRVRDIILRRPGMDIDLAIEGSALEMAKELAERHSASLTVHQRFKTASLKFGKFSLDVATARSESYSTPGALPEITASCLTDDLKRRDFSINAMAISLNKLDFGTLIDPSDGRLDLKKGLIRILHPLSFVDDATRIFRAIRYEQRFGFSIEPKTLACLIEHKNYLATITAERLRYEFECIFNEESPEKVLKRTGDLLVLGQVSNSMVFGSHESEWFKQARNVLKPDQPPFSLYLALMCEALCPVELEKLKSRLNLTAADYRILCESKALKARAKELSSEKLQPSVLFRMLDQYSHVAIHACMITSSKPAVKDNLEYYLKILQHIKPELSGHEIKLLGASYGPQVGQVLRIIQNAKLDGQVKTRQDEINLAQNLINKDNQA